MKKKGGMVEMKRKRGGEEGTHERKEADEGAEKTENRKRRKTKERGKPQIKNIRVTESETKRGITRPLSPDPPARLSGSVVLKLVLLVYPSKVFFQLSTPFTGPQYFGAKEKYNKIKCAFYLALKRCKY